MATNQQRREAERRRLQRQLEERRAREAARKRTTFIASVIGTLVVIAAVVVIVVVSVSGPDDNKSVGGAPASASVSPTVSTSASTPATSLPTAPCASPPKGSTATFQGVTVTGWKDLAKQPTVKSLSQQAPTTLQCMDLLVGKGKPASPTSTVDVRYIGVLYKNGTLFDSSWSHGKAPVSFPLTGVVPGFTQGIGGAGKVAPMREGGRRIMILPASLGYGASGNSSIPANAPLVFLVDLTKVSG